MSSRKKDADIRWDLIEQDFRAAKKSMNQIAKEHGISRARIERKARNEGWERDLSDKINDAVKAKLNQNLVDAVDQLPEASTPEERERQIVSVVAQTQVEVLTLHREDIGKMRRITSRLVDKLEDQLDNGMTIVVDGKEGAEGTEVKVDVDLETAGKVINHVTNSYTRIVNLERQAFGMDDKDEGETYEEALDHLEELCAGL